MGEWAVWAEIDPDAEPEGDDRGDVDESLEARRLSRWLKAMFSGGSGDDRPDDEPGPPRS